MKRSMLPTCILGICVLQGLLGFTTAGYADQTIIVVSKSGPANYASIQEAVTAAAGILTANPQHVVIEV